MGNQIRKQIGIAFEDCEIDITVRGTGNSTSYEIVANGAQFNFYPGHGYTETPLRFVVNGEWEMAKLMTALSAVCSQRWEPVSAYTRNSDREEWAKLNVSNT